MIGVLCSIIAGAVMSLQGVINTRLTDRVGIFEANVFVQGTAFCGFKNGTERKIFAFFTEYEKARAERRARSFLTCAGRIGAASLRLFQSKSDSRIWS